MEVGIVRQAHNNGSITLTFQDGGKEELLIKDIKFFSLKEREDVAAVMPVFLKNGKATEYFKFPSENKTYTTMTFLIKQEGVNGWSVSIDLTANDGAIPKVAATDFLVL